MILFGDITGLIVKFVENSSNETLNSTDRLKLEEDLKQDGVYYAVAFSIVGIISAGTSYLASLFYAYSSVRQVRTIIKYLNDIKTLRY